MLAPLGKSTVPAGLDSPLASLLTTDVGSYRL